MQTNSLNISSKYSGESESRSRTALFADEFAHWLSSALGSVYTSRAGSYWRCRLIWTSDSEEFQSETFRLSETFRDFQTISNSFNLLYSKFRFRIWRPSRIFALLMLWYRHSQCNSGMILSLNPLQYRDDSLDSSSWWLSQANGAIKDAPSARGANRVTLVTRETSGLSAVNCDSELSVSKWIENEIFLSKNLQIDHEIGFQILKNLKFKFDLSNWKIKLAHGRNWRCFDESFWSNPFEPPKRNHQTMLSFLLLIRIVLITSNWYRTSWTKCVDLVL